MSQLPIDLAIVRFKENEERLDKFVNELGSYTTNTASTVETIASFLTRVEAELESISDFATVITKTGGGVVQATIGYQGISDQFFSNVGGANGGGVIYGDSTGSINLSYVPSDGTSTKNVTSATQQSNRKMQIALSGVGIAPGTAAAPGLNFIGFTTSGFANVSGAITQSIGGVEYARMATSGNILIGTTTDVAGSKLNVAGTARVGNGSAQGILNVVRGGSDSTLQFLDGTTVMSEIRSLSTELRVQNAQASGFVSIYTNNGSTTAERLRFTAAGFLGIGITPTVPLHVAGAATITGAIIGGSSAAFTGALSAAATTLGSLTVSGSSSLQVTTTTNLTTTNLDITSGVITSNGLPIDLGGGTATTGKLLFFSSF